jgi:hypothetical protein
MSTLQHLVRADARRFLILIAVWIVVVAAAAVLAGVDPFVARNTELRPVFGLGTLLTSLAGFALVVTLIALVVQQHPLVGSDAWWMTRPVAPRTLLGSRMVLIGLLVVVVPAICDAVLMAFYRVPVGQMARVTLEWALLRGVGMLLVMAAAALTKTFARFVLLVGACLIGAAVAVNLALLLAISEARGYFSSASSDFAAAVVSRPSDPTALVAAWIVLALGGLALLWSQYTTRSRPRSAIVGIAGAVLALIVGVGWPWPLLHAESDAPAWATSAGALRLEAPPQAVYFDNAGLQIGDVASGYFPRWRTAHVRMYARGVPDGWVVTGHVADASLNVDGRQLRGGPVHFTRMLPASTTDASPIRRALQLVLGVDVVAGSGITGAGLTPILTVPSTEVPEGPAAADYRGEFVINTMQLKEAGVLPLQSGAVLQDGSYRIVLDEVRTPERGPVLEIRASRATSAFDRRALPRYTFYLRNRRASEAVAGTMRESRSFQSLPGEFFLGRYGYLASPYGFVAQPAELLFPSTFSAQLPSAMAKAPGGEWTDDAWLRDAELVVVKTVDGGSVTRRIEITRLTINPSP